MKIKDLIALLEGKLALYGNVDITVHGHPNVDVSYQDSLWNRPNIDFKINHEWNGSATGANQLSNRA